MTEQSTNTMTVDESVLVEILENTRKTKNYIKWQLIITVVLVVLPIIAVAVVLPMVMSSLSSAYGLGSGGDILQGLK